jgi:hypothetical protein
LSEIHEVELADQAEAGKAWSAGMEGEGALNAIILEQGLAARDFLEDFRGKIFAIEE